MTSCARGPAPRATAALRWLGAAGLVALASPPLPVAAAGLPSPPPVLVAELHAVEASLEAALASGDPIQATGIFLDRSGPCFRWVSERWAEARRGQRRPKAWALRASPFAWHEGEAWVQLDLWLHDEQLPPAQASFDLKLRRLGGQWRVAEPLALDRPERRLVGLRLAAQSEGPGQLLVHAQLELPPKGPDPHLFWALPEGLEVVGLSWGGQPLRVAQVGQRLHAECPPGAQGPLSFAYRLPGPGPSPLWWPLPMGMRLEGPLQAKLHPSPGLFGLASGAGLPIQGAEVGLAQGAWGLPLVQPDPGGTLSAHLAPDHAHLGAMLLAELADARRRLAELMGPRSPEAWAIAEVEGAEGSVGAGLLALPPAWLAQPALAAGGVMVGASRSWLAGDAVAGSPAEQALLTEGLAQHLALRLHELRDGPGARVADLQELARRLAAQPKALAQSPLSRWPGPLNGSAEAKAQALQALRARGALLWTLAAQGAGEARLRQALLGPSPRSLAAIDRRLKALGHASGLTTLQAWMDAPMPLGWAVEGLRAKRLGPRRFSVEGTLRLEGQAMPLELPLVLGTVEGQKRRFGLKLVGARTAFSLPAIAQPTALWVDPLHETPLALADALPIEPPAP